MKDREELLDAYNVLVEFQLWRRGAIEAQNGKRRIRRRIYAVRRFAANEGLKYRRGGFTACFVPEGD